MKPARVPQTVVAPDCWGDLPWGELYRKALERQLNPWFTKMYGFHLLKIGNLSAEINCEACAVSHQVNVSAQGMPVQGKRLVRTVLIFTESSDQLSRATDRVPGLPASPGYVQ